MTFEEREELAKIAKELCYGKEVINKIKACPLTEKGAILAANILRDARLR